jgi:DNA invertase Pin-like site-specific DNA recombinase
MKIGYARVSTDAQETHLQMDALNCVKCARIYEERASGAKAERPELMKLSDNARKSDVIIVWKLDRLARSLRQLIDKYHGSVKRARRRAAFPDGEHQYDDAERQVNIPYLRSARRIRARYPTPAC